MCLEWDVPEYKKVVEGGANNKTVRCFAFKAFQLSTLVGDVLGQGACRFKELSFLQCILVSCISFSFKAVPPNPAALCTQRAHSL